MKPGSQNAKVLTHLETNAHLTPLQALGLYGVFRLAARINDLKAHLEETNDGREIATELVLDPNGKTYARYSLVQKPVARAPIPRDYAVVPYKGRGAATQPVVMR